MPSILLYPQDSYTDAMPDDALNGDAGTPPAIGTVQTAPAQFGLRDLLGSIGSASKNAATFARDIGTAVGTAKASVKQTRQAYKDAEYGAQVPSVENKLRQWWLYSSTNDKLIAALGAAAVVIGVIQLTKK
jgi:hypothetical protein